jgi:cation diffusion facilitator CzcD-associated flavoprotein CzcO
MATFENIIIGAGPYGLSVAAHLRGANVSHAIVGRPMESWRRHMPAGMALKSEAFASGFSDPERRYTLARFHAWRGTAYSRKGVPIAIADFIDYADWFQRQAVPEIWDATLRNLRWTGNGFELTLDDRQVLAKRVIIATGHLAFRHLPQALSPHAHAVGALVSHSADHRDLAKFSGRDVTVIGCGQSGLETAALLHEAGANVRLLARAPAVDWNPDLDRSGSLLTRLRQPESGLGPGWRSLFFAEAPRLFAMLPAGRRRHMLATAHAPAGAWWLKNRVVGKFPLLTSHEAIAAAERGGRLELSVRTDGDGVKKIVTDHVIAATGYRVDLGRVAFLDAALRGAIRTADGAPVLNSVFESSVPGLHFVGLASALSFGPVMRFVCGARHAAAILASHLRSSARQRSSSVSTALGAKTVAR